ncbi:hypothetical protein QFC22_004957 [Naganishia vaughanmartiniae]|uniref:Uncharacterized protein n=1 Tax=Naganishia vaughanmartiniae TaxID=1424756 RepID=A0ACC2WXE7_9TREE|nr:hypothetical protein QFC22_004957 [Naganishia vaughanmartiniae]
MALSWIFPRAFTAPPSVAPDGAYSYFDGALLHYDLEHYPDKYVSRTIFKAGNKYTGNGRAGIAVPPYHYHPYQDEHFEVVTDIPLLFAKFWCPADAMEDLDVVVTASGPNGPG